jgi:hypothetical protein
MQATVVESPASNRIFQRNAVCQKKGHGNLLRWLPLTLLLHRGGRTPLFFTLADLETVLDIALG